MLDVEILFTYWRHQIDIFAVIQMLDFEMLDIDLVPKLFHCQSAPLVTYSRRQIDMIFSVVQMLDVELLNVDLVLQWFICQSAPLVTSNY